MTKNEMTELHQNKTVLITGASAGIGKAFADVWAEAGFNLVLTARREARLVEIAKKTKPGLLVLHHILFWDATEEELLDEISQTYDGLVSVGSDMMIY